MAPKATNDFLKLLKGCHTNLKRSWKLSLNGADLETLNVECTALDLDAATDYVKPVPLDTMTSWLKQTEPWKCGGYGPPGDPNLETLNWTETVLHDLFSSLIDGGNVMSTYTNWKHFPVDMNEAMGAKSFKGVRWNIKRILNCGTDKSIPHISALLAQDMPLHENEISGPELVATIELIYYRNSNPMYYDKVIPITLISVYTRNIRVLHAYADTATGRIHVRKSRILNLDVPDAFKGDDWKRLMCWSLAEPRTDKDTKLGK